MNSDLVELATYMLTAWISGYVFGLTILHIRKYSDFL